MRRNREMQGKICTNWSLRSEKHILAGRWKNIDQRAEPMPKNWSTDTLKVAVVRAISFRSFTNAVQS